MPRPFLRAAAEKGGLELRVLLVMDRLPWPLAQGMNLRVYNFARELARHCELDLAVMHRGPVPVELSAVFGEIDTV